MFEGIIAEAGRDHLIMDLANGKHVLIPMIYIDYFEFDEKIEYLFK